MTKLLEQVLEEASKLSDAQQDECAQRWLDELSDKAWDERFAGSLDVLDRLAAEAIAEDDAGLTRPLEELLEVTDNGTVSQAANAPSARRAAMSDSRLSLVAQRSESRQLALQIGQPESAILFRANQRLLARRRSKA